MWKEKKLNFKQMRDTSPAPFIKSLLGASPPCPHTHLHRFTWSKLKTAGSVRGVKDSTLSALNIQDLGDQSVCLKRCYKGDNNSLPVFLSNTPVFLNTPVLPFSQTGSSLLTHQFFLFHTQLLPFSHRGAGSNSHRTAHCWPFPSRGGVCSSQWW